MGSLLPDRHPNKDFFILDVADAAPKDDMASMEHPVFSLSVKRDMRQLSYEHNGNRLVVIPSGKGLATIMDKDIVLYCISKLVHQINEGKEVSQWVELSAHEVMVATNWRTNRESYQRFEDALDRLRGTTIKTDIETGGQTQLKGFGLIDAYEIDRKNEKGDLSPFGRMTKVRVKLSDWTFRAVNGMEVLSISPQYFRLRRPLERRIYELARKHVGDQDHPFKIGIGKLQKKVGSSSPEKKFRFFLKGIIRDNNIPEYLIEIDRNNVIFRQRKAKIKVGQGEQKFGGQAHLQVKPDTFGKARRKAPGYDIQNLYHEWRDMAANANEPVRNADAAFLGFCAKRSKENPIGQPRYNDKWD